MHYITETDVYDVRVERLGIRDDKEVERWGIVLRDSTEQERDSGTVEYSSSLLACDPPSLSEEQCRMYAVRSLIFKPPRELSPGKIYGWGTNNWRELLETRSLSDDQLDYEILKKAWRFFRKYPHRNLDLLDLQISINADPQAVSKRVGALIASGYLSNLLAGDPKLLRYTSETFQRIESRLEKDEQIFMYGGYFKEVPLPEIHLKPYVFVLMPFREDEFPQRVYHKVIEPTLRVSTGINCLRADTSQNAALITDQIYTQIKRANVIVAEITTLNPNVLIEIGVALALGKQVYMFHDSVKRPFEKIPFYLNKVKTNGYSNDDELIGHLQTIEIMM